MRWFRETAPTAAGGATFDDDFMQFIRPWLLPVRDQGISSPARANCVELVSQIVTGILEDAAVRSAVRDVFEGIGAGRFRSLAEKIAPAATRRVLILGIGAHGLAGIRQRLRGGLEIATWSEDTGSLTDLVSAASQADTILLYERPDAQVTRLLAALGHAEAPFIPSAASLEAALCKLTNTHAFAGAKTGPHGGWLN